MTNAEQLIVPLGTTARIKKEAKAVEAAETLAGRSSTMVVAASLALAAGSGTWVYLRTLDIANTAATAAGALLCALVAAVTHGRDHRRWMDKLAARASEWETLEARLRVQLSEQIRREQEVWVEHAKLMEQVAALTNSNAGLTDELNRRKQAERTLSQQRQDLARSNDVLGMHVQARAQEMEKMQRRHELILNSAGEGICGVDVSGRVAFVNPVAARILGGTVERMVGRPVTELFPGLKSGEVSGAEEVHDGRPSQIIVSRSDGSNFVVEYFRSALREGGHTIGEVLVFTDITERKKTEEALAHRTVELTRSNAELEQFAFVASHDLQEPLRKIQAFGDRLKAKCETANLGEGREYLERMQNASARMRRLIDDLLTFSRVISRTEPFAPVDLQKVAREVLSDLEVRIEKTGATVHVHDLPTIEADPLHMRQLLQNLIGNALKFHEPGAKPVVEIAGRIVAGSANATETALLGRRAMLDRTGDEQCCELTVRDNGIGFAEKYLDRIFAVFQRLHGRQEYEGTGIGLAVCRRIVDRHGGTITARSKPGEGATFIVMLPVEHQHPRKAAATT
jgi:PAS domain S-box-containing protein